MVAELDRVPRGTPSKRVRHLTADGTRSLVSVTLGDPRRRLLLIIGIYLAANTLPDCDCPTAATPFLSFTTVPQSYTKSPAVLVNKQNAGSFERALDRVKVSAQPLRHTRCDLHPLDGWQADSGFLGKCLRRPPEQGASGPNLVGRDHDVKNITIDIKVLDRMRNMI